MAEKKQQPRLKKVYEETIVPAMLKEFGLKNKLSIPALKKISVNIGVGKMASKDSKSVELVATNVAKITGQKPIITKAKKSVAGFKLREGLPVGVAVTLRGPRMYEFLDRLINISLPRVRDFRGLDVKSFDKQGNYAIGLKEHTVFPEIVIENLDQVHGIQVNINLNKKNKEMGVALLRHFGFPFKS